MHIAAPLLAVWGREMNVFLRYLNEFRAQCVPIIMSLSGLCYSTVLLVGFTRNHVVPGRQTRPLQVIFINPAGADFPCNIIAQSVNRRGISNDLYYRRPVAEADNVVW